MGRPGHEALMSSHIWHNLTESPLEQGLVGNYTAQFQAVDFGGDSYS